MRRVAIRSISSRRLRTALTALAIVLGVAMVSGAYTLTDTMRSAADSLSHSRRTSRNSDGSPPSRGPGTVGPSRSLDPMAFQLAVPPIRQQNSAIWALCSRLWP